MNMKISLLLENLDYIARHISKLSKDNQLGLYAFFRTVSDDLILEAAEIDTDTKTSEELGRFKFSIETICGLSEGNGRDSDQHISWMIGAVSALRSDMCLGKILDRPE